MDTTIQTRPVEAFYFDYNPLLQVWVDEFRWDGGDVPESVKTTLTDVVLKDFDNATCATCGELIGAHLGYDPHTDTEHNAWTVVDAHVDGHGSVTLYCEDCGDKARSAAGLPTE